MSDQPDIHADPQYEAQLRGPQAPGAAPQATQDYTCAFLMPPTPGEIAQFAMRKDSAGRLYFAFVFGQGGQGVKVYRRDPDGSVAFLGRAWPVSGYNCAGFDMVLDPPVVAIGMTGHDLHAPDPTQRGNGPMWTTIPCGVAPGDPATAVPQEWGANIPVSSSPPPPAPEPAGPSAADIIAAFATALTTPHHALPAALGDLIKAKAAAGVTDGTVGPLDKWERDRGYQATISGLQGYYERNEREPPGGWG